MAGFWSPLNNQPQFSAGTMLLLTDGTVLCHEDDTPNWYELTPDAFGSYINGSWSTKLAAGPNSPLYFASAVLRDGRVFVAGGEYNGGQQVDLLAAEIYDPAGNTWTNVPTPPGWTNLGDANCCVLPDGRVLVGSLNDNRTAIYDPTTNAWTAAGTKNNANSNEETWTLLPDQTVLTADCNGHPQTEKYVSAADKWVACGSTPHDLVEGSSKEIGPALLLPDGRVFAVGATGWTALYTMPPIANQPGTWADGPTFPMVGGQQLIAKDAPGCLLPNGKVLCAVGPLVDVLLRTKAIARRPISMNSTRAPPRSRPCRLRLTTATRHIPAACCYCQPARCFSITALRMSRCTLPTARLIQAGSLRSQAPPLS